MKTLQTWIQLTLVGLEMTKLNSLSNDIFVCGFVVVVYTLCRWMSQNGIRKAIGLRIKDHIPSREIKYN